MSSESAAPTSRVFEYSSAPTDGAQWMHRHRDQPCVFRNSTAYLFNDHQSAEIEDLFAEGWKRDAGHSLLSCVGQLRMISEQDTIVSERWALSITRACFVLVRRPDRAMLRAD
jgi:hypothetical protein